MEKNIVISELDGLPTSNDVYFNLKDMAVKKCLGCFGCWWTTPGKCVQKDMDEFYRAYINTDQATFFMKLEHGFVSANMKALFDRMIPLFLPYTTFRDGGTYHVPRYPKYPNIKVYYDYDFQDKEELDIFHSYIMKVFEQFYSTQIDIYSLKEYQKEGVL